MPMQFSAETSVACAGCRVPGCGQGCTRTASVAPAGHRGIVRVEGAVWLGGGFSGKVNVWCLAVAFAASPGAATLRDDG